MCVTGGLYRGKGELKEEGEREREREKKDVCNYVDCAALCEQI